MFFNLLQIKGLNKIYKAGLLIVPIMKDYEPPKKLREIMEELKGRKFTLDCGHHITFGYNVGNDIVVYNGKIPKIICLDCDG